MRRLRPDLIPLAVLFVLPLILFWPQTVGGRTLLPTENLYQYPPYAAYRQVVRAPDVPHNHLLSDLVLQNMQWKAFIRQSLADGEIPLWNPHQFGGIAFLAAGQHSAFYPFSVLYYVLPLGSAYGWVTLLNHALAGALMYAFMRGAIGTGRTGSLIAGVTYQLCGFLVASAVFPMITGAAAWLPLMMLAAHRLTVRPSAPWLAIGALAVAFNVFSGHPEMTIYSLLITAWVAGARLAWSLWRDRRANPRSALQGVLVRGGWISGMVGIGFALSAVQLIPLVEVAGGNWRAERSSLDSVLSYAHAPRDLLQYLLPNFYGSPAHHHYFDWFRLESVPVTVNVFDQPITHTEWGWKNYVEGALYVGILPLALAAFALILPVIDRRGSYQTRDGAPNRLIFALLTLIALTFMFGLPTYAVIYALPGVNQLNTAFRWVYGVTVGVAVLAGIGADLLAARYQPPEPPKPRRGRQPKAPSDPTLNLMRRFGVALIGVGGLALIGLIISRVFYAPISEPAADWILRNMTDANGQPAGAHFSGPQMFYSYQFTHLLIFALMASGAGAVFLLAAERRWRGEMANGLVRHGGPIAAVALIAVDLLIASWNFNPASDPLLLEFTPPSVEWLLERQAEEGHFRYTTIDAGGVNQIFQPNMTMRYGLDDIRGYDSIISAEYVDYMRATSPQNLLDFNRIAPLSESDYGQNDWGRLDLLNVRYLVTGLNVELPAELTATNTPHYAVAYQDQAVRIWRNNRAYPRAYLAYTADGTAPSLAGGFATAGGQVTITRDTGREKEVEVRLTPGQPGWLVISEAYAPGWRALIRPRGAEGDLEQAVDVERVLDIFQGVRLDENTISALYDVNDLDDDSARAAILAGDYTVRLVYSPASFQVGLFGSVIGAALLLFAVGAWSWNRMMGARDNDETGSIRRVARNSLAPILLNLFNRGIDFAFAFVMLRVLGPEEAGIYYYAGVVFVWFDIFTNFGLDVYVIREASRQRDRAGYFLLNTTLLRLILIVAAVPLLIGFLMLRQAAIDPPLAGNALAAIGLLYIGLAPGSLSKGLTALYYAFERAEFPAAVQTLTTINKAVLGLGALLLGYGIVGLAAVSIGVNIVTLAILVAGARAFVRRDPTAPADPTPETGRTRAGLFGAMIGGSWPLMLNHFLATIFFQIDIVLLEAFRGARVVGQYSVAYRWLLAINVIPAFFTQALLPVMSRQAESDPARVRRTYMLAVRLLVIVACPLAAVFTFTAEPLTWLLGGEAYLPEGAIALQIMIWSIPIGWINSLTQYALVALDLQRRITGAFAIAVTFNIVTNLLLIPRFGYPAAALTTIASEAVLLGVFARLMSLRVPGIDWLDLIWRPALAVGIMLGALLAVWPIAPLAALLIALAIYPAVLIALRPFSAGEWAMLAPILPARVRRLAPGRLRV